MVQKKYLSQTLKHNKEFLCNMLENASFDSDIVVLAGPYHMDKKDFEYKQKRGDI